MLIYPRSRALTIIFCLTSPLLIGITIMLVAILIHPWIGIIVGGIFATAIVFGFQKGLREAKEEQAMRVAAPMQIDNTPAPDAAATITDQISNGIPTSNKPLSRQRVYQLKNEALGLCSKCGRIVTPGKKLCQMHIDYHRKKARENTGSSATKRKLHNSRTGRAMRVAAPINNIPAPDAAAATMAAWTEEWKRGTH